MVLKTDQNIIKVCAYEKVGLEINMEVIIFVVSQDARFPIFRTGNSQRNLHAWVQDAVATRTLTLYPPGEFEERIFLAEGAFGKIYTSRFLKNKESIVLKIPERRIISLVKFFYCGISG